MLIYPSAKLGVEWLEFNSAPSKNKVVSVIVLPFQVKHCLQGDDAYLSFEIMISSHSRNRLTEPLVLFASVPRRVGLELSVTRNVKTPKTSKVKKTLPRENFYHFVCQLQFEQL